MLVSHQNISSLSFSPLCFEGITIEYGSPLNETNSGTTQDYLYRGEWRDIEFMSVPGGTGGGYTGALTRGIAKAFEKKIKTSTPVIKIDHDGEVVEVYTADGEGTPSEFRFQPSSIEAMPMKATTTTISVKVDLTLTTCSYQNFYNFYLFSVLYARSTIVTVPLGVLKNSVIEFVPSLNDEKLEAIDVIGMGNMNKVLMFWDNLSQNVSWWPEGKIDIQLITEQESDSEDWTYFYNEQSHAANKDYYVLSSWCGGDACDRLEKKSDEETMDIVLENLRKMFGYDVPTPSKYIITRWRSDEFSGGAYSYDTVGFDLTSYRNTLSEPLGNMYFAGEATDTDGWFGTAVGAYTSGVKAASKIGESGILESVYPEFQPVCTQLHGSCGGEFDEACCSGLSCVVDNRNAPMPTFASLQESSSTISRRSFRRICSPNQRARRDIHRLGSISTGYRLSRTGP